MRRGWAKRGNIIRKEKRERKGHITYHTQGPE